MKSRSIDDKEIESCKRAISYLFPVKKLHKKK